MSDAFVGADQAPPVPAGLLAESGVRQDPPAFDARGKFLPGNRLSPGRRKGSRAKLNEAFWSDLYDVWVKSGKDAVERMCATDPGGFIRVIASRMPQEVLIKAAELEEMGDAEILDLAVAVRSVALADSIEETGGGTGEEEGEGTSGGQLP